MLLSGCFLHVETSPHLLELICSEAPGKFLWTAELNLIFHRHGSE